MAQAKPKTNEPTVDTILPRDVWQAVAEGIKKIGHDEGALTFTPDGFETRVKDRADVALIRQRISPDVFEHYDVDDHGFTSGINVERLDELLNAVADVPVSFGWDWDSFRWDFQADDVDYQMGGLEPDTITGSPAPMPPIKDADDLPDGKEFNVDVTVPIEKFDRATDVVDMNSNVATFTMGGEDEVFVIAGDGDNDDGGVKIHEDDRFEWNEAPPTGAAYCRQSNKYMKNVADIIDEDTVRIVTGPGLPYHLFTTREGVIDTKIVQAPRVDKS